jgi:hypothetical protein
VLGLPGTPAELVGADGFVGLAGSVDNQRPGLRIATPTGVKASVGGSMTLVMAMCRSCHSLMVSQAGAGVFRALYGSGMPPNTPCVLVKVSVLALGPTGPL